MFISDFNANVSTLNFGSEKETRRVHEVLHANGIVTISELCHLSKKHIESLELDPALVELHLKKNGLSFGMTEKDVLIHQQLTTELLKTNPDETPNDEREHLSKQVQELSASLYSTEGNWSERFYEMSKELFLNDHSFFRSKDEKFRRATSIAQHFILRFMCVNQMMIDSKKEKNN